jgi:hypothetical protein
MLEPLQHRTDDPRAIRRGQSPSRGAAQVEDVDRLRAERLDPRGGDGRARLADRRADPVQQN